MKHFFAFILFLVFSFIVKAQLSSLGRNQPVDSLVNLIQTEKEDTLKVIHLIYLSREISRHNVDSAMSLSQQAKQLSESLGYKKGLALSHITSGWCQIVQGNYPSALKLLSSALELGNNINDSFIISVSLTNIGTVYHNEKDYAKAIEYFNRSLKIDRLIDNKWGVARNLGVTGTSQLKMKKFNEAINSFKEAYTLTKEIGNENGSAIWLANIGDVHFQRKDYKSALDCYLKSLTIFEKLGNLWVAAETRISIAKIGMAQKQYSIAAVQLYKALYQAKQVKSQEREKDCYEALSNLYEISEIALPDSSGLSLLNREEMKIYSIYFLKKAVKLNEIVFGKERQKELQRFEQAGKDALKEAELNYERRNRNIFLIASILSLIGLIFTAYLAFFALKKLKENKKFSAELELKNRIIERKQTEITDSIQYAQRIQQAILPILDTIHKAFPESFILFKPKDIVSGDFYWFQEVEGLCYLAACDCTGHGVPGALMSMVATDMLNDALLHSKNPGEILSITNRSIKQALKQSLNDDSTRDGMDLALCCIDKKNNKLIYAGAYRPLWLIKKNTNDIIEYKATKFSVGGLTQNEQQFSNYEINFLPGDTFYLFSDGYSDQFSSQDKKLMTKRFKEVILTIQSQSMKEQGEFLSEYLSNWKGAMEQTDDVLVIGVRL